MKRTDVIGLSLAVTLLAAPAAGAEASAKPRAKTAEAGAATAASTSRPPVGAFAEAFGRIVRAFSLPDARPAPRWNPPPVFDVDQPPEPCIDPIVDPNVPCRVHQPIGG